MRPSLNIDLPDPEWLVPLRAEHARGKTISQIARETGMARPSVSMLIAGTYPAQSLDLVSQKHGVRVVQLYRDAVPCPHRRLAIPADDCRGFAQAPMSTSDPDRLAHWRACRRCTLNPVKGGSHGK